MPKAVVVIIRIIAIFASLFIFLGALGSTSLGGGSGTVLPYFWILVVVPAIVYLAFYRLK